MIRPIKMQSKKPPYIEERFVVELTVKGECVAYGNYATEEIAKRIEAIVKGYQLQGSSKTMIMKKLSQHPIWKQLEKESA